MPPRCGSRAGRDAILDTYADIALAAFEDSLAKALDAAADALIADPSEATLEAARNAWRSARIPYQQTEAFRYGNAIVDEWEVSVNAWPLDEGPIGYVAASYGGESDENGLYAANVIANPTILVHGIELDASQITPALLQDGLQEAGGIEANVATGYHAIEFLLLGAGPERHRSGRRHPAGHGLQFGRACRPARRLSRRGNRPPGRISRKWPPTGGTAAPRGRRLARRASPPSSPAWGRSPLANLRVSA